MLLYHGSNIAVKNPKIIPANRALDFGYGFYLTSDYDQAVKWAKITFLRRDSGTPTVSVYDFDECDAGLSVLTFPCANADWLNFVTANRSGKAVNNDYDVIIGPVANDNTMPVINLYLSGAYSEDEALRRLLTQKLMDQYTIKTETGLKCLKLTEVIEL